MDKGVFFHIPGGHHAAGERHIAHDLWREAVACFRGASDDTHIKLSDTKLGLLGGDHDIRYGGNAEAGTRTGAVYGNDHGDLGEHNGIQPFGHHVGIVGHLIGAVVGEVVDVISGGEHFTLCTDNDTAHVVGGVVGELEGLVEFTIHL